MRIALSDIEPTPPLSDLPLHPVFEGLQTGLERLLDEVELTSGLKSLLRQLINRDLAHKQKVWPLALLPVLTCELTGGQGTIALPAALVWNLLHLAAYLLDHLQDGDELDAPLPPPQIMNAAVSLIFLAQLALDDLPAASLRRELQRLALAMCANQHRELSQTAELNRDLAACCQILAAKSGAPLAWAGRAGAVLAGANPDQIAAARDLGYNLGILLQLSDDWAGLEPSPGNDLTLDKQTLPLVYALHVAPPETRRELEERLRESPRCRNAEAQAHRLLLDLGALHYLLLEMARHRSRAQFAIVQLQRRSAPKSDLAYKGLRAFLDIIFPLGAEVNVQHPTSEQIGLFPSTSETVPAPARHFDSVQPVGADGNGRLAAFSEPYTGLDSSIVTGEVTAVEPGGPADLAGLQRGDLILPLDGETRFGRAPRGPAALSVLRKGRILSFTLEALSPSPLTRLNRLIPLLVALGYSLLSFWLWGHNPYDRQINLFLALNQVGAAVLTFGLLSALGRGWAALWFGASFYLIAPLLIHFHALFPRPRPPGRVWPIPVLYSLSLAAIAFMVWTGYPQSIGLPTIIVYRGMYLYFVGAVLASTLLLLRAYLVSSFQERQHIRLVVLATILALTPLTALAVLPDIITGSPSLPYTAAFPFLLLIPLAYAYAIRRHNLLTLDRALNRSLVVLTLAVLLAGFYLLLAALLEWLLPSSRWREPLLVGVATLVAAFSFHPLRTRLQKLADRFFYGGWYDYQTTLESASRVMSEADRTTDLAQTLLSHLKQSMRLDCACLLLAETEAGPKAKKGEELPLYLDACPECPLCQSPERPLRLPQEGALMRRLFAAGRSLSGQDLRAELAGLPLSQAEQSLLACPRSALWLPLRNGSTMWGAFVLGPKTGADPFTSADRLILETLAQQTAIAVGRLNLLAETEYLYRELALSREEERKRLALDLHDDVIQEMLVLHRNLAAWPGQPLREMEANLQEGREQLEQAIDRLRDICTELRPAALDLLGAVEAIQAEAQVFAYDTGLRLKMKVTGDERATMPEMVEVTLYRVFQEILRNIEKHARAGRIDLKLHLGEDEIRLTVRDNGQGFLLPARLGLLMDDNHFGLVGVRERLGMIGGRLRIGSEPGRGTEVTAILPGLEHWRTARLPTPHIGLL